MTLDEAWAEAEAALPEGWVLTGVVGGRLPWRAEAASLRLLDETGYRFEDEQAVAEGPTPAAALQALAAKLRATRP